MIKKICIKNIATFGQLPEELDDLEKVNFVYGPNGTGKTTISRAIANDRKTSPHYSQDYSECEITWQNSTPLETFVYNRDFIDKNFNQPDELEGIFTLGEEDIETVNKISVAKEELDLISDRIERLKATLEGVEGSGGKLQELQDCEDEFTDRCWRLKQKYDDSFKGPFTGFRGDRAKFREKLIAESISNSAIFVELEGLKERAETIFNETPQILESLIVPDLETLLSHETNPILQKRVIGRSDVDIAELIEKLGNSDWVKQGREFYNQAKPTCPFCQQNTDVSLEESLNEYFDDNFIVDSNAIERLFENYTSDSNFLMRELQNLLSRPTEYLKNEKLEAEINLLSAKIGKNIQFISEKKREVSKQINLESVREVLGAIKVLLESANSEISAHNKMVENLQKEKKDLTDQVWRSLLEYEIKDDLASYNEKKAGIGQAISSLREKINTENTKRNQQEERIRNLEKNTTSIQPTINDVNGYLADFGFQGFSLAKSERDRFYKLERSDHSDAKTTLSEGERSFIAFLYFYHLLKGSKYENGITSDRVVVFDDPVSSLDSDILFIVSILIQNIFQDVRNNLGSIKQVFVLTHNVYFHKEVSFDSQRKKDEKFRDETFWMVRKSNNISKIQKQESNPIKSEYELLWSEVRNPNRNNSTIQNTLRRILENYFKLLGGVNIKEICDDFEGREKILCKTLFSWLNAGSHAVHEPSYFSQSEVENYLSVFRQIFEKTDHIGHYKMMMGDEGK